LGRFEAQSSVGGKTFGGRSPQDTLQNDPGVLENRSQAIPLFGLRKDVAQTRHSRRAAIKTGALRQHVFQLAEGFLKRPPCESYFEPAPAAAQNRHVVLRIL
jgi:hypothetical protein